jgi:UDP-N-acetylmuramyl pentapeptide synthase
MALLETSIMPGQAAFAPPLSSTSAGPAAVIKAPGVTILHAPHVAPEAANAALKSLRGLKGARRRVVWCNATELARTPAESRALGEKLVDEGGANMVVVSGDAAREIAVAARDSGLALGRVVVCRDDATARNVLGDSIAPGDAVLALAVDADSCQRLAERLESKFEQHPVAPR